MRPSWPVFGTIVGGCVLVAAGLRHAAHAPMTTLALVLAAGVVAELFEPSDREGSREPIETEPFRLVAGVHVCAIVLLGPWVAAVVAFAGAMLAVVFRVRTLQSVAFRASVFAWATGGAGVAFRLAGGRWVSSSC